MAGSLGEAENLRFDVVSGRHDRQPIVDIAGLRLPPGTLVALAGPSGSGKSTLLYLLCGLLKPSAGRVTWDGADLGAMSESRRDRWRRDHAGLVFQNFHLIDELSPLDNVLAPGWFSRLSVKPLVSRAESLLDRFGVPRQRSRASLLSRGEQQRVALARALLFDPQVVFADEPTASLDSVAGERVVAALRDLALAENRTVIVATHDPALLAASTLVVRLDHGSVVAQQKRETAA